MSRPEDREGGATVVEDSRLYMIGGLGGSMGANRVNVS
jgi:hypothetical protein